MEVKSHVTEVTPEVASLKLPLRWQLFEGVAPLPHSGSGFLSGGWKVGLYRILNQQVI